MFVADEFASVNGVLKSTVDFAFGFVANRLIPSSICEMGANRTLMLVVVRGATGLPFECAHPIVIGSGSQHSFIGFSCGILSFPFRLDLNSAKRAKCRKTIRQVFFRRFFNCRRAAVPMGGNLFSSADNLLTTRSRSKHISGFWIRSLLA
jgi:hypothetical protein